MANKIADDKSLQELIKRAARDLVNAEYAIALTGAGMSTESGIPDWRGSVPGGVNNPDAEKPAPLQAALSYQSLLADPGKWWQERLAHPSKSARERANAVPNPGHYALAELEKMGVLLSVITSNVDGLDYAANTNDLVEFHGSSRKLRCIVCLSRFQNDSFDLKKLEKENKLPPRCPNCGGVLKPDGVSFGEAIPIDVARRSNIMAMLCDLMLICGTTASVKPFADLPYIAKRRGTKIIEVNTEPTHLTEERISDYLIQGKTGEILPQIVAEVKRLKKLI
jgi:NAD-dependent deacetylase